MMSCSNALARLNSAKLCYLSALFVFFQQSEHKPALAGAALSQWLYNSSYHFMGLKLTEHTS
jgi:hypothetical protein